MCVAESQKVHINALLDPAIMWTKLNGIHQQKIPATNFNPYDAPFNICKQDNELLVHSWPGWIITVQQVKNLPPDKFDLNKLDNDYLAFMALICALPEHYNAFLSNIIHSFLPSAVFQVKDAFVL